MTNIEIKYPIILIRNKDYNLYGMEKDLGLISKGGESFYKRPIQLIDKDGFIFELKSRKNIGRAKLLNSIRFFQPMQQMQLEFIEKGQISLIDLKKMILSHIKTKPKHLLTLGTMEMIEEWVYEKNTISELIKMFK